MRRALAVFAAVLVLAVLASEPAGAGNPVQDRRAAQQRANAAAARLAKAESALARVEAEAAALRARADANRADLAGLEQRVRSLAVNQYMRGSGSPAPVFDGDLGRVARGQALARYVTLGDTEAIDRYRAAREDFEANSAALQERLRQQAAASAALRKERAKAYAELERLAAAEKAYLARQAAEQRAAAARRGTVRAARSSPGVLGSGSWVCPVQGPRSFSNDWGQPRSGGRRHQGNDILSPRGTPVVASVSGNVRHHNSSLGGLSYYLAGDDGNTYFGTHLSRYGAAGRVSAGTVVGYVGDTGNARGTPHLHFEIHPGGGAAVNPYPTLSRYC
jgi:murein DD-endopeptidase MepM/ murein hydrolase activator NlpD